MKSNRVYIICKFIINKTHASHRVVPIHSCYHKQHLIHLRRGHLWCHGHHRGRCHSSHSWRLLIAPVGATAAAATVPGLGCQINREDHIGLYLLCETFKDLFETFQDFRRFRLPSRKAPWILVSGPPGLLDSCTIEKPHAVQLVHWHFSASTALILCVEFLEVWQESIS